MKNLTLLLIFIFQLLISNRLLSQASFGTYPALSRDSSGKDIVLLSLKQAQDLDNKADLLLLLEKVSVQMNAVDSFLIKVINDKNTIIEQQDLNLNELRYLIGTKDRQIINLRNTVTDYTTKEINYRNELENKDLEIKLHISEISKLKRRVLFGGLGSGTAIILVTALLLTR
jgi:hypothetical protein